MTVIVQGTLVVACGGEASGDRAGPAPAATAERSTLADSTIPQGERGTSIRRGLALLTRTTDSLPEQAPGNIQCASCHVEAGRRPDAATLIGTFARFPRYMERAGAVVSLADRINFCVLRSLAGTPLAVDGRDMHDIVAYLEYLSTGEYRDLTVKHGSSPRLAGLSGDSARGAAIYSRTCAACHGAEGDGHPPAYPALWGRKSYSIGASMAREDRAASFIRQLMPRNNPGSLSDQEARDVARFINSHARPDTPDKEHDWPKGDAPSDVPYGTAGHTAHRPPARLIPRTSTTRRSS